VLILDDKTILVDPLDVTEEGIFAFRYHLYWGGLSGGNIN
jgi:hypothetical protein